MPQGIFDGYLLCSPLALWFYVLTGVSSFLSLPVWYLTPFLQRHFRHAQWRTSCLLTLLLEFWRWAVNCDSWLCVNGNVISFCITLVFTLPLFFWFWHPRDLILYRTCAITIVQQILFFFLRLRAVQSRLASVIFCLPSDSFIVEGQLSAAVLEHRWCVSARCTRLRGLERRWRRQRLRLLLWHTQASDVTRK